VFAKGHRSATGMAIAIPHWCLHGRAHAGAHYPPLRSESSLPRDVDERIR